MKEACEEQFLDLPKMRKGKGEGKTKEITYNYQVLYRLLNDPDEFRIIQKPPILAPN